MSGILETKLVTQFNIVPKNVVRYNRILKKYTPQNDSGVTITLSSTDKLTAQINLLHYDCSPVALVILDLLQRKTEYFTESNKTRLVKAGFILRDGLLSNIPGTPNFYCRSQSTYEGGYTINYNQFGYLACECVDYQNSSNYDNMSNSPLNGGANLCKHVLAIIIDNKL